MWACALMPRSATAAARSIIREKPGADSGAPRSETNTNGDGALAPSSVLGPADVQGCGFEVDLLPAQVYHFGRSKAMPEGQKHHERNAMAVAVLPGRLDQPLDLIGGEVLAGAQLYIWCAPRRDCSIFSGWRDQSQVRFCHDKSPRLLDHCSINRHFIDRIRTWVDRFHHAFDP